MPAPRRHHARVRVPVAAGDWAAQPLQHFKVPALRRRTACGLVPVAAVRARPLQRGQRAIPRGPRADLPRGVRLPAWTRPRPRPVQAPPHPRQPPHRPHHRRVPCAHPRARVRVAGRPHWEARPERVTQRAAGEREAERVVLVHRVGDRAEAAAGVEQGEGGGGERVHCGDPRRRIHPAGGSESAHARAPRGREQRGREDVSSTLWREGPGARAWAVGAQKRVATGKLHTDTNYTSRLS